MLVRARCAPHFKRLAYEKDPNSPITKATGYMGGGCLAGTNYARVTPNGELTPCPYMPLSAGNIRETQLRRSVGKVRCLQFLPLSATQRQMRRLRIHGYLRRLPRPSLCRSRRLAGRRSVVSLHAQGRREDQSRVQCPRKRPSCDGTTRRQLRLSRIPYFLRAMVKKGVEKHAQRERHPTDHDRADGRTPQETLRQRRTGLQFRVKLRTEVLDRQRSPPRSQTAYGRTSKHRHRPQYADSRSSITGSICSPRSSGSAAWRFWSWR